MVEFPVIQIEAEIELPEQLGTKEKFWIEHEGRLCLLKFGREGTGENWSEKVACELCGLLGLPHAHYDLASFGQQCGVLSPSLVETDGRLILGNELINRVSPAYEIARSYQQKEHTVSRVIAALALHTRPNYPDTWHQFLGYLMLDAWIGNTDRHHENWGLIMAKDRSISLAPTFDHASSLGRELTDDTRLHRLTTRDKRFSVRAFAEKAASALYAEPTDARPLSPLDAFTMAAARVQRNSGQDWLKTLARIRDEDVLTILSRVPEAIMSAPAKNFAHAVLDTNKIRLLSLIEQTP